MILRRKRGTRTRGCPKGLFFLGRSSTKNVFRREVASYFTYIGKRRKCCVKWLQRRKKSRAKSFLMSCFRATIFSRKSSYFLFAALCLLAKWCYCAARPPRRLKSSKIRKKMMKTLFTKNPKCDETMQHSASNVKINNLWFFSDRAPLKKSLEQWKISKNIVSICLWSNFFSILEHCVTPFFPYFFFSWQLC